MVTIQMKRYQFTFLLPFLLFLISCASLSTQQITLSFGRPKPCQEFLNRLDEVVKEAGVRDASNVVVPGFPYLRTNRFLAALKKNLKEDGERDAWVRWMQELDLKSRKKEISNLPDETILSLMAKEAGKTDREELISRIKTCSSELLNHDQTRPDFYTTLDSRVDVPDEYSFFRRAIGLYPLITLPVAVATNSSRKKIRTWFNPNPDDLPIEGQLRAFVPYEKIFLHEKEIEAVIEESSGNPLGVPLLDVDMEKKLVRFFSPVFIQDVAASYDRLGQIVWRGDRLEVDPEKPTVYYYLSHAFLKGKPILQINYVIWYPERAGKRTPWLEFGHLDGLTTRVSLDGQGKVFMVEVMMNCGCYRLFAPEKERVDRVVSKPLRFDPFMPQWLPVVSPGERLGIRVNSGWHQVERLIAVKEPPDPIPYELVPYDVLEALPHEDGRTESVFDNRGIIKGSERVERFILFSMGIPSVGSMRQQGHHAVELIGRVHFDDPFLFDQNFIFK